jgi:hypothetical protein
MIDITDMMLAHFGPLTPQEERDLSAYYDRIRELFMSEGHSIEPQTPAQKLYELFSQASPHANAGDDLTTVQIDDVFNLEQIAKEFVDWLRTVKG